MNNTTENQEKKKKLVRTLVTLRLLLRNTIKGMVERNDEEEED